MATHLLQRREVIDSFVMMVDHLEVEVVPEVFRDNCHLRILSRHDAAGACDSSSKSREYEPLQASETFVPKRLCERAAALRASSGIER